MPEDPRLALLKRLYAVAQNSNMVHTMSVLAVLLLGTLDAVKASGISEPDQIIQLRTSLKSAIKMMGADDIEVDVTMGKYQ